MSLAFLSKKSWHTAKLSNNERTWVAEQKKLEEDKKLLELERQIKEERELEELQEMQHGKPLTNKLDWMYKGPQAMKPSAQEYLEGKAFTELSEKNDVSKLEQGAGSTPGSLYLQKITSSANENFAKIHGDPLLAIKRKQLEARQKVLQNPIVMAQVRQQALEKALAKRQRKKEKKKEKRSKKEKHRTPREEGASSRHHDGSPPSSESRHKERARSSESREKRRRRGRSGSPQRRERGDRSGQRRRDSPDASRRGRDSPERSRPRRDSPERFRRRRDSPERSRPRRDSPERSRRRGDTPERSRPRRDSPERFRRRNSPKRPRSRDRRRRRSRSPQRRRKSPEEKPVSAPTTATDTPDNSSVTRAAGYGLQMPEGMSAPTRSSRDQDLGPSKEVFAMRSEYIKSKEETYAGKRPQKRSTLSEEEKRLRMEEMKHDAEKTKELRERKQKLHDKIDEATSHAERTAGGPSFLSGVRNELGKRSVEERIRSKKFYSERVREES